MEERIEILLRGNEFKRLRECELAEIRKQYNLKRIEIEILYFLSKSGSNDTSAGICKHLNANKGHISQAVDNLCKQNYIMAIPDTRDRRYIHYQVTDESREIVERITKKWKELNKELFAGVTEEEMEELKRIAGKIGKNMERLINQQGKMEVLDEHKKLDK